MLPVPSGFEDVASLPEFQFVRPDRSREVIGTLHFVFIIMCVLYYLSDIFNFLHPFVKNLIKNKYLNIKS